MSELSEQRVVLKLPGMATIEVRQDVQYASTGSKDLSLDVYYPPESTDALPPVVVFISGYSDPGFEKVVGCKFKDMGAYVSWAQLIACSGMVGIAYENESPRENAHAAINFVKENAEELGIDPNRIGIWSCSGNAPTALSLLSDPTIDLSCAVFCYGYLMDLDGNSAVAKLSAQFGFVDAMQGSPFPDLINNPFLLVRAGQDKMPHLNESADRFVARCLVENLPLTLVNYPNGSHAFDLSDDSEQSIATIRRVLDYLRAELCVESPP